MPLETHSRFGVIGDPVDHSLSPRMHNTAFADLGLPYLYLPFHVRAAELSRFVRRMGRTGLGGINVTIPHKTAIVDHMDRLSDEARRIGAVNTVVLSAGRRVGHNTDGRGFILALKSKTGRSPKGESVLIFGAGGAARGIAFALAQAGIRSIVIVNRGLKNGERLAMDLKKQAPHLSCEAFGLGSRSWKGHIGEIGLIIQTTPVGMDGRSSLAIDFNQADRRAVVCDLIYRPTPFLKKAAAHSLKVMGGLPLLLWQGALAFQLWTGRRAPLAAMEAALRS